MADTGSAQAGTADPVGRVLLFLSWLFVLAGGFLMSGLVVMVVVSVLGRWLFNSPIFGDFELVTMGTAVAVFLFLPYCHLQRGNVVVDLFLSWAPKKLQILFDGLSGLLLAAIAGMMAWRMSYGLLEMYANNETSYILALPVWPVFPVAVAAFALLAATCLYTAVRDFIRVAR